MSAGFPGSSPSLSRLRLLSRPRLRRTARLASEMIGIWRCFVGLVIGDCLAYVLIQQGIKFIYKKTLTTPNHTHSPMLQTATINYHSPTHAVPLANLHPSNATNINGRIISRSPTNFQLADQQRNLSPNKLNATKKPMIGGNQGALGAGLGNFTSRGRGNASPSPRGGNLGAGFQNFGGNGIFGNNAGRPLLNSKGYGIKDHSKPLFSQLKEACCENHPNKPAQFYTESDNEQVWYCQKCAITLASKGFPVIPKSQPSYPQSQPQTIFQQHRLEQFYLPQYAGKPEYMELQKFISTVDGIHHSHLTQIHQYQTIEEHYRNQFQLTQHFYNSLLELVTQMKEDHLADLESESKKHSQLALIKQDHLKSKLQQIETIRKDLTENIEVILTGFDQPVVQQNFGFYKQQIFTYQDQIEEEREEFGKLVIDEKEDQLRGRLKKIQEFLLDVWNQKTGEQGRKNGGQAGYRANEPKQNLQGQDKSPRSVKHLLNLNQKTEAEPRKQRQGACRKLFEDDDNPDTQNDFHTTEQLAGQRSPQFKNI